MTPQEIIKEIKAFPLFEQVEIVEEIQKNIKQNFHNSNLKGNEISTNEKLAIVENLGGALKMKNPPMTKAEERQAIEEILSEKHK